MATASKADVKNPNADLAGRFPAYAWMLNEPGVVATLSNTDISTPDQFIAAVQGTDWWKNTLPSMRSYEQLQAQDPQGFAQQQGQEQALVNDAYKSLGIAPNDADVQAISDQALRLGWSTTQLNDAVVAHIQASPGLINPNNAGSAQTSMQQLQDVASKYLVPLDQGTAQSWATQIAAGEKTANDYTALLQQQAKVKYAGSPDIQSALNQGLSTSDALSSYKTDMAKMLNVAPETIDFMNNPTYSKVLNYTDPKTGQSRVMSYGEMENYVRSTPQYDQSPTAINAAADGVAALAKTMGKVA